MIWIKRYRLPLLTLSTVLLFAVFLVRNLISMETLNIKNEQFTFSESANGRWGAFTYDLDIKLQKGDLVYSRTYKRLALSNLFFNLDRVKESDEVSLYMPKSSVSKNLQSKFYYVGGRKTNFLQVLLNLISYMITNQIFIFIIPLLSTLFLCNQEYKKDYSYHSQFHKLTVTYSKYVIGIFMLLIAFY